MKFRTETDKILFLLEMGQPLQESLNEEVNNDLFELFFKRRREKTFELKDYRKSQVQKQNWRKKKLTYLRGINKFHRSIAGKKFHRAISRFLLTRESYNKIDLLKATSSLKTHLFIDLDYYRSVNEAIDFDIFVESITETLNSLEAEILAGGNPNPEDYIEILEALNYNDISKSVIGKEDFNVPDDLEYIDKILQRFPLKIT